MSKYTSNPHYDVITGIHLRDACGISCGDCGTHTVLDADLAAGDYVLIIEGFSSEEGEFSITMNCPTNGVFLDGAIACGQSVAGSTVGAGSHVGNGASDHVYSFTVAADVEGVTFDSCGSEFDTYLRVLQGSDLAAISAACPDINACDQFQRSACDDCGECGVQTVLVNDPLLGTQDAASLTAGNHDPTVALPPGDYMLVIEGYASQEGVYSVAMSCRRSGDAAPPPPSGAVACDGGGDYLVDSGVVDKTQGYGHGHDCNWYLSCSDPAASPILTFSRFNTEANFDYVTVYDGDNNNAAQLGRFHGETLPDPVQSHGNNMLVRFTTDASIAREGFLASFICTTTSLPPPPPDACISPGLTMLDFGVLESDTSGSAGQYANSLDCRWTLTCTTGFPQLTFDAFDTETNFDFVNLFDGPGLTSVQVGHYDGEALPPVTVGSGSTMTVQFVTDGSVNQPGFGAAFTCSQAGAPPRPPSACQGGGLTLRTPGQLVIDASDYQSNVHCQWDLQCTSGSALLTFTSFSTEANFDWVAVYEGPDDSSAELLRYAGSVVPAPIQAGDANMLVTFVTDGSVIASPAGFTAEFSCSQVVLPPAPPDACLNQLTLVDGGGFDKVGYGHSHDCNWLLTCSNQAQHPVLSFTSFNTEANFDFVTAYDGASNQNSQLGHWSGAVIPPVTEASSAFMLVQLTSDASVLRDGFVASYTCASGALTPPPPTACSGITPVTLTNSGTINQDSDPLLDDGVSGTYTHDLECTWILECTAPGTVPTVSFDMFDTESNYDFVTLYAGSGTNMLEEFSGRGPSSDTSSTSSTMTVQFTSDESVSQTGFSLNFICTPGAGGGTPPPPPTPPTPNPFTPVPPPPPAGMGEVTTMATSRAGMTTVRLTVTLDATMSNVYALAGTDATPMSFPAAFQLATPFGADIGGANAAFFAIMADAEFDSWLTIGITDGTNDGAIAASPGFAFPGWTETGGLQTTNGAIFYMNPSTMGTNVGAGVVMAQITSATPTGMATAGLQGKSTGGAQDWDAPAMWSW